MTAAGPGLHCRQLEGDLGVDIWTIDLDRLDLLPDEAWEQLCAAEHDRAQSIVHAPTRERFIAARAALRVILARYLGGRPRAVPLCYGAYGKPALEHTRLQPALEFNVSHSGARALVAVAQDRRVGIDIEAIRTERERELARLVERFFSPAEQRGFAALPSDLQPAAFYGAWTCKEAYLKALGTGLHVPLDEFDVEVDPRRPARLLRPHVSARETYLIHTLPVASGFAAALAVECREATPVATSTRLRAAAYL